MSNQSAIPDDGLAVERAARVLAFGLKIFGDEERARQFLNRPHTMLDNDSPLKVATESESGAVAAVNLLGRAAYSGGV